MRISRTILTFLFTVFLSACSADLDDYQASTPRFDLFEYFEGQTLAWGMIQDYTNKQTRRFEVKINGAIDGKQIVLVEDFVFDDGEKSQRIWTINKLDDNRYQGTAGDIIGVANGKEEGNALHWVYDFEIPQGDSTIVVTLDDWLYRQDERRAFNLTKIKKFGLEVGQITLFFEKQ